MSRIDPTEKRAAFLALKEAIGQGRLIPEKRRPFTASQKREIAAKSDGLCAECGGPPGLSPEYDHIKPRNWGGETTVENGQLLCKPCHTEKCRREAPEHAKAHRLDEIEQHGRPPGRIRSQGFDKPTKPYAWPKGRGFESNRARKA